MRKSITEIAPGPAHTVRRTALRLLPLLIGLGLAGLTLYAYRNLPERPFAADDYQWLLNVQDRDLGALLRAAFDPTEQTHFYRPLVWLLFWVQLRLFGLEPLGFHLVSLGLHLLNAGLLGALVYRLLQPPDSILSTADQDGHSSKRNTQNVALLAGGLAALHPAPFEAVAWVAAQSELLAAALLLAMLHLWVGRRPAASASAALGPWPLAATLVLALALLAKESAVIGLGLLALLEWSRPTPADGRLSLWPSALRLAPPGLLTLGYLLLQVQIGGRNYLLGSGGYGLGWQLVQNPLRSLALIAAPLPGTERADTAWLPQLGAVVAALLGLILLASIPAALLARPRSARARCRIAAVFALLLTLLPTAPFVSPPDSRYLYLSVFAAVLLLALLIAQGLTAGHNPATAPFLEPKTQNSKLKTQNFAAWLLVLAALLLLWQAPGEVAGREGRFAAATGPGGSLWRLASALCAAETPQRLLVVEPPLAGPHAEAIVRLACGPHVRPMVVARDQIEQAIEPNSVVVAFPNGSAEIERRT
ncbi:MAG TPA: hypothetical protein VFS21_19745 [Roseiflexaceae bacterium]|nr:hypothetical protein [Roseiflexaceae bacterium]